MLRVRLDDKRVQEFIHKRRITGIVGLLFDKSRCKQVSRMLTWDKSFFLIQSEPQFILGHPYDSDEFARTMYEEGVQRRKKHIRSL